MFYVLAKVDRGKSSHENEDRMLVCRNIISDGKYEDYIEGDELFCVVCDGVGGAKRGDVAAEITVHTFSTLFGEIITEETILYQTELANENVLKAQRSDIDSSTTSTTIAGLYITGNDFFAFNSGNSRVCKYRAPYNSQVTTDHTLAEELVSMGMIDDAGKADARQRSTITRYLGREPFLAPDVIFAENKVQQGDIFILSTDGFHDFVSNRELENILKSSDALDETVLEKFYNAAIENGSRDNISIILIKVL